MKLTIKKFGWKIILPILLLVVIVYGYIAGWYGSSGKYDKFANCLTEKGAIFYGSFQCSHCKTQKDLFGESIKYVNYVECGPLTGPMNKICKDAGIEAYPTWVINGTAYVGQRNLDWLSLMTGCAL